MRKNLAGSELKLSAKNIFIAHKPCKELKIYLLLLVDEDNPAGILCLHLSNTSRNGAKQIVH